jgi:hypothetical protein
MFAGSGARCELGYEDGVETDGELVDVRSLFGGPSSLDKIGGIQGSVRSEELGPKRPRYDCLASLLYTTSCLRSLQKSCQKFVGSSFQQSCNL